MLYLIAWLGRRTITSLWKWLDKKNSWWCNFVICAMITIGRKIKSMFSDEVWLLYFDNKYSFAQHWTRLVSDLSNILLNHTGNRKTYHRTNRWFSRKKNNKLFDESKYERESNCVNWTEYNEKNHREKQCSDCILENYYDLAIVDDVQADWECRCVYVKRALPWSRRRSRSFNFDYNLYIQSNYKLWANTLRVSYTRCDCIRVLRTWFWSERVAQT